MNARTLLTAALACALMACAKAPEPEPSVASTSVPVQSEASRFLMEVEVAQRSAQANAQGIEMLRALAERTEPRGLAPADFAAVRRDMYLRAAWLAEQANDLHRAQDILRAGLDVEGHDPFRVQLYLLAATVAQRQADKAAEERAFEGARAELDLLQ